MDLVETAKAHGGQIGVPTGALLGLDAVTAAAEGTIRSVTMVTRKPVKGLMGAPFLEQNNIKIDDIKAPMKIFSGSPREAAVGFPANLNVAVALGLAGIGVDKTTLEIWADPGIDRNTHSIQVDADSASFSMTIGNIPSENPKTGRITALSPICARSTRRCALVHRGRRWILASIRRLLSSWVQGAVSVRRSPRRWRKKGLSSLAVVFAMKVCCAQPNG